MLSSNPELMLLLTVQCYRWGNYSIERLLLVQGYRGWESQDLNASSRSMLWCIMHTAFLGIGAHQAGLAWSLDTLITTFWGLAGTPGLWAIMPLPDAKICSSQLPPFAMVPLNGLLCFCKSSLWVPWECVVPLHTICTLWGPGPTCGRPFWMPVSTNGAPLL